MYRQINVHEEDRVYQHILWRRAPSDEVQEFELCTVTYGVNASPFLAILCLHQLNLEDGPEFPLTKDLLVHSTYVDDIMAGANSVEDILQLQSQLISLLYRGRFLLKKWASNCMAVLKNVDTHDRAMNPCFEPKDDQSVKVLGLHWNPSTDAFGYHTHATEASPTKRSILSTIARLYDPIGAMGPVMFIAKGMIQQLWKAKLDWDEAIPREIAVVWDNFITKLPSLSEFALSRHMDVISAKSVQLLGFADASEKGYAAIAYLRIVDTSGDVRTHFITCKTKVAPLKASNTDPALTIPRLELCAALLLSRLLSHHLSLLQEIVKIDRVCAWSDSTIVLAWLAEEPKQFKTFVSNRVVKIHTLLPQCEWAHVRSAENPADPASRGMLPTDFPTCKLHSCGPDFIRRSDDQWLSVSLSNITAEQLPEVRRSQKFALHVHAQDDSILRRFSALQRIYRVLAFRLRFADRARRRTTASGLIKWQECEQIHQRIVILTQRIHYSGLLKQLNHPQLNVTPNALAQLAPFIDRDGIIRVGGRLKFATLPDDAKHPILLPKESHLTKLIIWYYHLNLLHGGTRLLLSMIQRRYWITSARAAIRQVTFSCVPCTRHKAASPRPFMSELPHTRVQPFHPFTNVGMDYGGPFIVKEGHRRKARTDKAYLALFICLSTKAVYLEIVANLTTESFMAALDRFVARRGIPTQIQSDCGTNYVGAAKKLKTLFRDAETQGALPSRFPCEWKFNPSASPHSGGIWEAAIKSTKTHLKRVIGTQVYTMEELGTLVTRVEGVLNSRPLASISNDPNDLCVLTPGHFLIG